MSAAVIITAAAIALIVLPPKYNPRLCSCLHGNVLARAGALGKDPLTESVEFDCALGRLQLLDRALADMRNFLDLASASTSPLSRVQAVAIRLAVLRLRGTELEDRMLSQSRSGAEPHAQGPRSHGASSNEDPAPLLPVLAGSTVSGPSSSGLMDNLSFSTWQCWLRWVACEEDLKRLAELRDGYRASKDRLERFTKAVRVARAIQEAGIVHLVFSAESALAIAVESYLRSKRQFMCRLIQAEAQQHALRRGIIAVFAKMCPDATEL